MSKEMARIQAINDQEIAEIIDKKEYELLDFCKDAPDKSFNFTPLTDIPLDIIPRLNLCTARMYLVYSIFLLSKDTIGGLIVPLSTPLTNSS